VWDTQTLVTLTELVGHYAGVTHVAFSPTAEGGEGKLLASVGLDDHHSLIVHDWRSGAIVASCKGNPAKTLDVSWSPQVMGRWGV
jgi:microtubule-associated protein-like 6